MKYIVDWSGYCRYEFSNKDEAKAFAKLFDASYSKLKTQNLTLQK